MNRPAFWVIAAGLLVWVSVAYVGWLLVWPVEMIRRLRRGA